MNVRSQPFVWRKKDKSLTLPGYPLDPPHDGFAVIKDTYPGIHNARRTVTRWHVIRRDTGKLVHWDAMYCPTRKEAVETFNRLHEAGEIK